MLAHPVVATAQTYWTEENELEKFDGELNELQNIVSCLGYEGNWNVGDPNVFRSGDGAVLNWWASTGTITVQGAARAKEQLANRLSEHLTSRSQGTVASVPVPSQDPTDEVRTVVDSTNSPPSQESQKVFVVYGHDEAACDQLELVLRRLELEPFVLGNTGGGGMTIIEALEKEIVSPAKGKRFGIVLLTPDDMGYEQDASPDDAEPRARQNVVMEMGMLIAAFGRMRVAILKKGHVEVPSDASGIIYISFNNHVKETASKLCQRLRGAGFELDPDAITAASA